MFVPQLWSLKVSFKRGQHCLKKAIVLWCIQRSLVVLLVTEEQGSSILSKTQPMQMLVVVETQSIVVCRNYNLGIKGGHSENLGLRVRMVIKYWVPKGWHISHKRSCRSKNRASELQNRLCGSLNSTNVQLTVKCKNINLIHDKQQSTVKYTIIQIHMGIHVSQM